MKTLKSFYEGQLKTEDILLTDLVPYVTKPENETFYIKLKEEIVDDGGMRHPILVVPFSSERVKEMIKHPLNRGLKEVIKNLNIDLEELILVVIKGNNRFYLAKELECDRIECIVTQLNDIVGVARANRVLQEH
tara:strand:+ start:123 stop:524 length:402 start_codon:yes stop_codon:yes gene_type:complete